ELRDTGGLPAARLDIAREVEAAERSLVDGEGAVKPAAGDQARRIGRAHAEFGRAVGIARGEQGRREHRGVDVAYRDHAVHVPAPAPAHVRLAGDAALEDG